MQASSIYYLPSSPFLSKSTAKSSSSTNALRPSKCIQTSTSISIIKATHPDAPQVDYDSMASSVFPAEACETLGGVACDVEMFPETKLRNQQVKPKVAPEAIDREYLDYNSSKTVFIVEACDDLGGEFCDPAYQNGNSN